jgi:cellulose synthase operon protein C
MRSLNVKLLAATLVALALVGVGVHFLHAFQVLRNAASFKVQADRERKEAESFEEQADRKRKEEQFKEAEEHLKEATEHRAKAAGYLDRYLRLVPDDTDALVEYALLREKLARTPRQLFALLDLFERVLRNDPDQHEIRYKTVRLLMQARRWGDALDHLSKLELAETKDSELGELNFLMGECKEGQGKHPEAVESLRVAINCDKTRMDAYALRAWIRRTHLDQAMTPEDLNKDSADLTIEKMVEENADNPMAYILRIRHYKAFLPTNLDKKDRWEEQIAQDVYAALIKVKAALAKDEAALTKDEKAGRAEVLLEAAAFNQHEEKREKAKKEPDPKMLRFYGDKHRSYLKTGTEKHPNDFRFRQQLASLELASGHKDEAIKQLQHFIKEHPKDDGVILARLQLGEIFVDSKQLEDARGVSKELRGTPGMVLWADFLDDRILVAEEKWREAILDGPPRDDLPPRRGLKSIRAQLVPWPEQEWGANYLFAQCYELLDEQDLRLAAARRLVELAPLRVDGRAALASALAATGQMREALQESRRVAGELPAFDLKVAQLLFLKMQRLPKSARTKAQWNEIEDRLKRAEKDVEERLKRAEKTEDKPIQFALTRADIYAAQGDFAKAQETLEKARTENDKRVEIRIGLANLADGQDDPKKALEVLDQARKDLGDVEELRIGRARHWARIHALATRKLEANKLAAEKMPPESEADKKAAETETRRLEAEQREAEDGLLGLEQGLDKVEVSRGNPSQLLTVLAATYTQMGNAKEAERLWNEVKKRQPGDMKCLLALFELTLQAYEAETVRQARLQSTEKRSEPSDTEREAFEKLQDLTKGIQLIEGEEGTWWRFCNAAVLLTIRTKGHQSEDRAEAAALLAEAAQRRQDWPPILRLQGKLADMQGNAERAIGFYQHALKLGDRHAETTRRLVDLLWKKRRFLEADAAMHEAAENAPLSVDLGKLATAAAWMNDDGRGALDAAEQVAARSEDYSDHLWLAQQILTLALKKDKADTELISKGVAALNKATELANEKKQFAPEIVVAKVKFFTATKQTEKAEFVLKEAEGTLPSKAPFALVACYDVMGQRDKADGVVEAAIKAKPDDVATLRSAATFYVSRNQMNKAEELLAMLLGKDSKAEEPDKTSARRILAVVLASYGDLPRFEKALDLLDQNISAKGDSTEDQIVKAKVLATRPDRLKDAIELFEDINGHKPLAVEDQFTLARLYDANKDWDNARRRMQLLLEAVEEGPSAPTYVTAFVNGLIKHKELEEAEKWQEKLERMQPTALATLEMRVRLLSAQYQAAKDADLPNAQDLAAKAVALIEEWSNRKDAPLQNLAAILEEVGNKAGAEKLYRKLNANPKKPEDKLQLAIFLGRSDPLSPPIEALTICAKAREECPPEAVAVVSVAILRSTKSTDDQRAEVERWLNDTIKKTPSVELLANLAELRDLRGHYKDSEETWQRVLKENPNHVVALNNLACLIAYRHAKDIAAVKALELINLAIARAGPVPELLDSRAMVLLNLGKTTEAIDDLKSVIDRKPSASKHYHLALAYRQDKNRKNAEVEWGKAVKAGLKLEDLHPLEAADYKVLRDEMEPK